MNGQVRISTRAATTIRVSLQPAYPNEGCGALIGRLNGASFDVLEAIAIPNINTTRARDRFVIDPRELDRVTASLRNRNDGAAVIGFFHSHPDSPARPSTIDLDGAQGLWEIARERYLYIIVSVENGIAKEMTGWALSDARDGFDELLLDFVGLDLDVPV